MLDHPQESATAAPDELDELDLRLINTLQIDPRAPWTRVGRALGIDPVTAARRWERLTASGAAWTTGQPGAPQISRQCLAFVEVDCAAGQTLAVAEALADRPHVLTIEHTTGDRDLLLTLALPDLTDLSRCLLESMGSLPGVRATRSQLATHVFCQGGDWRLRALDAGQRALLTAGEVHAPDPPVRGLTDLDRRLIVRLGADGRTSLTDLAAELGAGISTVRRRLSALLASRDLLLRSEVAQPLSGWPVAVWLWAYLPPGGRHRDGDRDTVATLLNALPEARACLGLTGGEANLLLNVWLRSLHDARRLEHLLADRVPSLTVLDRATVLRFAKRMGRVLDRHGRSVRAVPMDIWSDPVGPLPPAAGPARGR